MDYSVDKGGFLSLPGTAMSHNMNLDGSQYMNIFDKMQDVKWYDSQRLAIPTT